MSRIDNNDTALEALEELVGKIRNYEVKVYSFSIEEETHYDENYLKVPNGNFIYIVKFSE